MTRALHLPPWGFLDQQYLVYQIAEICVRLFWQKAASIGRKNPARLG